MAFEALPTLELKSESTNLYSNSLPELVHLNDPALNVMINLRNLLAGIIHPKDTIDTALEEIKKSKITALAVVSREGQLLGMIAGEDILGSKPIKLLQERRIERSKITVDMIMVPLAECVALDYHDAELTKVGNVVITLKQHKSHYALAVDTSNESTQKIVGVFVLSQIAKQLHMDLSDSIDSAETLLELEKRSRK